MKNNNLKIIKVMDTKTKYDAIFVLNTAVNNNPNFDIDEEMQKLDSCIFETYVVYASATFYNANPKYYPIAIIGCKKVFANELFNTSELLYHSKRYDVIYSIEFIHSTDPSFINNSNYKQDIEYMINTVINDKNDSAIAINFKYINIYGFYFKKVLKDIGFEYCDIGGYMIKYPYLALTSQSK